MGSFDAGSTVSGAATGAQTGAQFGGAYGAVIGAVIGGVTGGVFGSRAKKKRKTAERLQREVRSIERLQARKAAIVEGISYQAQASVQGYADGAGEKTSANIGVQQSVYGQAQSNLKTEAIVYNRQMYIEKLMRKSEKYGNILSMLTSGAEAAGKIKGAMPNKTEVPSEIDTSTLPKRRTYNNESGWG